MRVLAVNSEFRCLEDRLYEEEKKRVRNFGLWREGSCSDFRASLEGSRVTELNLAG